MLKSKFSENIEDAQLRKCVQYLEAFERDVLYLGLSSSYKYADDTRANLYLTPAQMGNYFIWFKSAPDVGLGYPEIFPTSLHGIPCFHVMFSKHHANFKA